MAKINPSTHDIDAQQAAQLLQALKDCAELSGNRKRLSQRETIVFFDEYLSPLFDFDRKKGGLFGMSIRGRDDWLKAEEGARQLSFFNGFWTRDYNQLLSALRQNEARLSDSTGVRISYKKDPKSDDMNIFLGIEILMANTHDKQ